MKEVKLYIKFDLSIADIISSAFLTHLFSKPESDWQTDEKNSVAGNHVGNSQNGYGTKTISSDYWEYDSPK